VPAQYDYVFFNDESEYETVAAWEAGSAIGKVLCSYRVPRRAGAWDNDSTIVGYPPKRELEAELARLRKESLGYITEEQMWLEDLVDDLRLLYITRRGVKR